MASGAFRKSLLNNNREENHHGFVRACMFFPLSSPVQAPFHIPPTQYWISRRPGSQLVHRHLLGHYKPKPFLPRDASFLYDSL